MSTEQLLTYFQRRAATLYQEAQAKRAHGEEVTNDEATAIFEARCFEACLTALVTSCPAS